MNRKCFPHCNFACLMFPEPGLLEALPGPEGKGTTCKETTFKELALRSAVHREGDGRSLVDLFLSWCQFVCWSLLAQVPSCLACEPVNLAGCGHGYNWFPVPWKDWDCGTEASAWFWTESSRLSALGGCWPEGHKLELLWRKGEWQWEWWSLVARI